MPTLTAFVREYSSLSYFSFHSSFSSSSCVTFAFIRSISFSVEFSSVSTDWFLLIKCALSVSRIMIFCFSEIISILTELYLEHDIYLLQGVLVRLHLGVLVRLHLGVLARLHLGVLVRLHLGVLVRLHLGVLARFFLQVLNDKHWSVIWIIEVYVLSIYV